LIGHKIMGQLGCWPFVFQEGFCVYRVRESLEEEEQID